MKFDKVVVLGTVGVVTAASVAGAYGHDQVGSAQDLAEGLGSIAYHAAASGVSGTVIDVTPHEFINKSYFNNVAHGYVVGEAKVLTLDSEDFSV